MGDYDKILKENIKAIFLPLLEKMLDISIAQSFEIKDKLQSTVEREPDFLKRIIDKSGNEFILHLEFQTHNEPKMAYRMAEYQAMIQRKHELPVRQHVIFLGDTKPTMRTKLSEAEQITGFELNYVRGFSTSKILDSDIPEEIMLAILADYKNADAPKVINQIIKKLQKAAKSESELREAIQQLIILSRLRKLESEISQTINNMPIIYDKTTDGLYLEGMEAKRYQLIKNAILKNKAAVEQIAYLFEVDIDYVLRVQAEIEQK